MQHRMKKKLSLAQKLERLYCREDFEKWLDEMQGLNIEANARSSICQGLDALNIPHRVDGDYQYYKNLIYNHVVKTKKIIPFSAMEDNFLILLFEAWIDEDNKKLRKEIEQRLPEAKISANEYYEESFIYYLDDIHRMGRYPRISYELLFTDEEQVMARLKDLLGDNANADEMSDFVKYFLTFGERMLYSEKYLNGVNTDLLTRELMIWLASVYEVAEVECFGKRNHKSLPDVMSLMSSSELENAGYAPKNFDNCLDVYVAFSAYKCMSNEPEQKSVQ